MEKHETEQEQLARERKKNAVYWAQCAQQQKTEAASYERYIQSKKAEKAKESQFGGMYKPAARQSYEQWLLADESKRHLYAEAIREEQQQKLDAANKSTLNQACLMSGNGVSGGGHSSSSGGGTKYDSSMFACDDDEDDLGGTTSMLTAEELARGMNFDEEYTPPGVQEMGTSMTAQEMSQMLCPSSRDWMNMDLNMDGEPPPPHLSYEGMMSTPSDFFNHEGDTMGLPSNSGGTKEEAATSSRPPPSKPKQSVKSAISQYNAQKNKSLLSKKSNSDASTKLFWKNSSSSKDFDITNSEPSDGEKVVTDSEMNKMKNDLKIFQTEEEMTQLLLKREEINESLEKIEDTIEKIDTKLYRHERDLDNASDNSEESNDGEKKAIISQLHAIIDKLKVSQKLAEQKKDEWDEKLFVVDRDLRKVSGQLKSLKASAALGSEDVSARLRLPDIRNKNSR